MTTDRDATITFGHERVRICARYTTVSILDDFLTALWFLVGSAFFLYPEFKEAGA